jgi:peptide/nickel transport system permease protein
MTTVGRFLLVRLLVTAGTMIGVSVLLFLGSNIGPGNVATAVLGAGATPEQISQFDHDAGMDRPLPQRYASWLVGAARGDLGRSLVNDRSVTEVISGPFGFTVTLVLLAGTLTVVGALTVGVFAGLHPGGRLDTLLSAGSLVAVSVPQFVVAAVMVVVFASWLRLLPAVSLPPYGGTPLGRPSILVLPTAVLTAFGTAYASRLVRATVVDANATAHVRASRLAGLPERVVVGRHLLPVIAGPVSQTLAWLVGALFGGTAVVERVFGYPGLSQPLIEAVQAHDTPVVEGVGLMLAAVILLALFAADVIGVLADPRQRLAR